MNTEEVAKKVVELTRKQAWKEAIDTLYSNDIVSVEARTMDGSSPEMRGIDAVRGKTDWWLENMQVHSAKVSGPFVDYDWFVLQHFALARRHGDRGCTRIDGPSGWRFQ